jgi:hypothetical protein
VKGNEENPDSFSRGLLKDPVVFMAFMVKKPLIFGTLIVHG